MRKTSKKNIRCCSGTAEWLLEYGLNGVNIEEYLRSRTRRCPALSIVNNSWKRAMLTDTLYRMVWFVQGCETLNIYRGADQRWLGKVFPRAEYLTIGWSSQFITVRIQGHQNSYADNLMLRYHVLFNISINRALSAQKWKISSGRCETVAKSRAAAASYESHVLNENQHKLIFLTH